jgi:hypothetical protein
MLDSDAVLIPQLISPLDPEFAMPRPAAIKTRPVETLARAVIVATVLIALTASVAGCGQRGPLYYPDKDNPDRRR